MASPQTCECKSLEGEPQNLHLKQSPEELLLTIQWGRPLPYTRVPLASRVYFSFLECAGGTLLSFPASWSVLCVSPHAHLRRVLEGAWGAGPCPRQLGIFLRALQEHDSHIWTAAAVESGPLGAVKLGVEGGVQGLERLLGRAGRHTRAKRVGP